jgi:hypothetical protein
LVYATFIGGSGGNEWLNDIEIDASGAAYAVGGTDSSDFPISSAAQPAYGGGGFDGVAIKLSSSGAALSYSTFLGGSADDFANEARLDPTGALYVVGETESANFPVASPYQASIGGLGDGFVTKLAPSGSAFGYSTYLGGLSWDSARGLDLDTSGAVYVTGMTMSSNFPTASPYQASISGSSDGFVTKFSPGGGSLTYSTYLGGSITEWFDGIEIDPAGSIYVAGLSSSSDYPITPGNALQGSNAGDRDVVISKLSPTGSSLDFSTYLGGSLWDSASALAVDSAGDIFVTGVTFSVDFPTSSAFQTTLAGPTDAFVAKVKVSATGAGLVYSTYLGGSGQEYGRDITIDGIGLAYVTGNTTSIDFPITSPFQATLAGGSDAFAAILMLVSSSCYFTPLSTDYAVEGSTQEGFEEWLLLSNPDPAVEGLACVSILTASGPGGIHSFWVPPLSRVSVRVNDLISDPEVSLRIDSHQRKIYSERAMYISSGQRQGAHLGRSLPLSSAATSIYIPEGFTAQSSETWILVSNPSTTDTASIDLSFQTDTGSVSGPQDVLVPPQTRATFKANDYVPGSFFVGTTISSDKPVLAERASYLGHSGLLGATDSPGTPQLSQSWILPEGATAGPFETWILLSNPTSNHVDAQVRFLTSAGALAPLSFHLMPQTRLSIRADDYTDTYDVATLVTSDNPIATERALYSKGHPSYGDTASSAEGLTSLSKSWLTPEGAAAGGFETWTLVSNPSLTDTAVISLDYLTESGLSPGPQNYSLAPGSRVSFRANDYVSTYNAAAKVKVVSGPGVAVDHSVYAPEGRMGRDATGGPGIALGSAVPIP